MLTEISLIDKIEVLPELRVLQVRTVTRFLRDGAIVGSTLARRTLQPGADLSSEDPLVAAVAKAVWA